MFTPFQLVVIAVVAVGGAAIAAAVLAVALRRAPAPTGEAAADADLAGAMARVVPFAAALIAAVVGAGLGIGLEQVVEQRNPFPAGTVQTLRIMSLVAGAGAMAVSTTLAFAVLGGIYALAKPEVRQAAPWLLLAAPISAAAGLLMGSAALYVVAEYGGFGAFTL